MKSYNLEVYKDFRLHGFSAQAAIYYARKSVNNKFHIFG